jgi:hypothetical protein
MLITYRGDDRDWNDERAIASEIQLYSILNYYIGYFDRLVNRRVSEMFVMLLICLTATSQT